MTITFDELRQIKHQLPTGGVKRIAEELHIDEQTVRNYFGAAQYEKTDTVGYHLEPGPNGGIVSIDDSTILDIAKRLIKESHN